MNELVLGDSLEQLLDHRGKTPKKMGADFTDAGVPVVSAILVAAGTLNMSEARHVSMETFRRWMPIPTKAGDVLLTSEAPLGRVARVPTDEPLVLGQRLFALRGKQGVLDNGYLYYALQTERVRADLLGRSTGTTVFGIRQSALRHVRIPAPGLDEQRAIAEVLGALDDKIAANTRLAVTADDLTTAEFQRAVAGVAFSRNTFADIAEIGGGGTPSTKVPEYWDGGIPWASPTDITKLPGPYLFETSRTITQGGLANCASPLYPVGSILMTSRATIGAFALAGVPVAVNQGFIVVVPENTASRFWLFHEMRDRVEEFLTHANGATFLELSRGNFRRLPVRLADLKAMDDFSRRAEALHSRASAALRQNLTLAATRDALLPALMSGKLRVRDAERIVSASL